MLDAPNNPPATQLHQPSGQGLSGGELEQIQFLLGHVSIQTTERYLGCQQKPQHPVNDPLGIEPETA